MTKERTEAHLQIKGITVMTMSLKEIPYKILLPCMQYIEDVKYVVKFKQK